MKEGYDVLSEKLEDLNDTIGRVHEEVEIQNVRISLSRIIFFTAPFVNSLHFINIQAMLEQANADVVATKSVMDTLTDKTKEYLQTTDNCLTSLAVASCCACLIMVVVVFFLYGWTYILLLIIYNGLCFRFRRHNNPISDLSNYYSYRHSRKTPRRHDLITYLIWHESRRMILLSTKKFDAYKK